MGTFFSPNGTKVSGQTMSGKGTAEAIWETDIAAAVGRCERGGSAKEELAALFKRYPQLKEDRWKPYEHPVSPLIEWFTKQQLG